LNAKRRAMNYFTISFLGRTKAGKSTLHTVMTGEGDAFIGMGSQRTTRFNRVYEWDHLRIIDTPGIGAAEEKGRTDEEIAKSIIDETDVVCYIVTSDNVQKTEFNFLGSIREKNKPVIILLNVKKDFTRPEVLFKKFIADPHYWAERTDEENIQGHIDHIHDCIGDLKNYVKIIPAQLLAARLSKDEKFKQYSKTLYEGSHFDCFLDYIREAIVKSIAIRRSQTIIDSVAHYLNDAVKDIKLFHNGHCELKKKIGDKRKILAKKIEKDKGKVIDTCLADIEALFEDFKVKAYEFAENNYDLKDSLQSKWENYTKKTMRMEKRIEKTIKKHIEQEQRDIQEYLGDIMNDIGSFFTYEGIGLSGNGIVDVKKIVSIIGIVIGVVGTVIAFVPGLNVAVSIVVTIIGGVVALVSNLFKSKEKKRREAIEKLNNRLQSSLDEHKKAVMKQIPDIISSGFTLMSKAVDSILEKLENASAVLEKNSGQLLEKMNFTLNLVNKYYVRRIMDYGIGKESGVLNRKDYEQLEVYRDYGKSIFIKSNIVFSKSKLAEIEEILQEKILIEKEAKNG
jgi:GTPase Era involved in 16S rRNA processing